MKVLNFKFPYASVKEASSFKQVEINVPVPIYILGEPRNSYFMKGLVLANIPSFGNVYVRQEWVKDMKTNDEDDILEFILNNVERFSKNFKENIQSSITCTIKSMVVAYKKENKLIK